MVESSAAAWYVPASVSMVAPPSESMAIVVAMMNDRGGLWTITPERVRLLTENIPTLSQRNKLTAKEMLNLAHRGERFWPTKVEYYAVLSEIKRDAGLVRKDQVSEVIAAVIKGARIDNVLDQPWVRQTLELLTRISKEK
jgi:hypothetical protein